MKIQIVDRNGSYVSGNASQWLIVRRDAMTLPFRSDYAKVTSGVFDYRTGRQTLLLLPECFDYESEVNSGSLSINYGGFCDLSKPVMS